ncbi:hypothetical protein ACFSOZ_16195 [Mesorhizobium newzealandense]|uniref:Uncharacterized protein n=1 Tax=Mesorhizobium newzealandense TaxID=1300302 RepID=A0ABW4UC94_9HYPH
MHRFFDQPKSQIIGRFSRRALLIGAVASVPAIASAAPPPVEARPEPREMPVQRVNRLAEELAIAMDDWMADISHSDHPRALWEAHVWPASTGRGIYYKNHDRGLS